MKTLSRFLIPVGALLLCMSFIAVYSFLPATVPAKYSSPDEASNFFFSKLYADSSRLWAFDDMSIPTGGLLHPRSVRVVDAFLVPGGFLGLPVFFGGIGQVIGTAAIPFLTPIFGVLAALAWGALMTVKFGRRMGLVAGALLLVQPAWWYEASRTMQPNVLFCSLVIFSAYFFFAAPFKAMVEKSGSEGHRILRAADAAIAGILMAMALATRTSEAYWLIIGIAVAALAFPRRTPWGRLIVFASIALVGFAPFLALNSSVYGSPLATGYGAGVSVISAGTATHGQGNALLGPLRPYLFPLGFAPRVALGNAWTYGIAFFWWWSLLAVGGIAAYVIARKKRSETDRADVKTFALATAAVTVWLLFFYGSYVVQDNPDPNAVTIGSSYLRYWLPVAVFSTVPVAWLLVTFGGRLAEKWRNAAMAAAVVLIGTASGYMVFFSHGEGLLSVRDSIKTNVNIAEDVISITPQKAIIVTDFDDKYLFPERHVIVPLRSEVTYGSLHRLALHADGLFYLGLTLPDKDFAYLRDVKLAPQMLVPVAVKAYGEQTLYEFRRTDLTPK